MKTKNHLGFYCLFSLLTLLSGCASNYRCFDDRILNAMKSAGKCMPSEGFRLAYHQEDNQSDNQKNKKVYVLEILDATPNEKFTLYAIRLDGSITHVGCYKTNESLVMVSTVEDQLPFDMKWEFNNFMKGETIFMVLISDDDNNKEAGVLICPNPIEASWGDGASIAVTSLSKGMDVFTIEGKNLKPNEMLSFSTQSWDERIENKLKATEQGTIATIIAPMTTGKNGGINHITLERAATNEKISLKVPYGSYAAKYYDKDLSNID